MRTTFLILSLTAALAAGASAGAADSSPEREIRALRAQSNAAIAAHDYAAMRTLYLDDYTILPGSSGARFDIEAFGKRIGATFADPDFVTYVRTPERIALGPAGKRAAEVGTWVGTWRKAGRPMRLSGIYQAMWVPTAQGWRLKNESFVSLKCEGDAAACAVVD